MSSIETAKADRLAQPGHGLILFARDVAELGALVDSDVDSLDGMFQTNATEWDDWKSVRDVN